MKAAAHEATRELVPSQANGARPGSRVAVSSRPPNHGPQEFGIASPRNSQASDAGVGWHRPNARGSTRHLASLLVDRFHIRLPLFGALFSQDALVYHHHGALAHAWHWSYHSDLLTSGSGATALAPGPPAESACPYRLGRRLGRKWLRQLESH